MLPGPGPRRAAWLHRAAWVTVVLSLLGAACTSGPTVPDGYALHTTDWYEIALPSDWDVVDESGRVHQVADPASGTPMTVRISVLGESRTLAASLEEFRQGVTGLSDDAEIVDDIDIDVLGASRARQFQTTLTLDVAATGESLRVRETDVIAVRDDGPVVVVKVMGPDDDFDDDVAEQVLGSLRLVTSPAAGAAAG